MAENSTLIVGSHGEFQWLASPDHDISSILRSCPDLLLGKYLAVTSIDSGALCLTEQEKSDGWWTSDDGKFYRSLGDGGREDRDDWRIAYSPRLTSIHGLPNETHDECCAGFDEWYVFIHPIQVGEMEVFVNWTGFRLDKPIYQSLATRFWEQMERLAPESYIAEGYFVTLATRNANLFQSVLAAFSTDVK